MTKSITKKKTREEILELSVPLFAKDGYDGVSMRDVAAATGLTTSALYYHFADKEDLYLSVVIHDFRGKSTALLNIIKGPEPPWERLEKFIEGLVNLTASDKNFSRLMQWVKLDSDEARQHKLAEQVFSDMFVSVHDLVAELNSGHDAYMLAISIFGLIVFPFELVTTHKFMPGYRPEHDKPAVMAKHVIDLLRSSLRKVDGKTG